MRQIEKMMVQAVNNKECFKRSNTEVRTINGAVFVALHGNLIFASIDGKKYFSNSGWNTRTTASRLRALGADYSTNYKKCNCELTSYQEMKKLFYSAIG
jgi:hypothetical protein